MEQVPTPKLVAEWMHRKIQAEDYLYQSEVVWEIQDRFGDRFVYENANGNLAIDRGVLSEFRALTSTTVVWEPGDKMWRKREVDDSPGRRTDW